MNTSISGANTRNSKSQRDRAHPAGRLSGTIFARTTGVAIDPDSNVGIFIDNKGDIVAGDYGIWAGPFGYATGPNATADIRIENSASLLGGIAGIFAYSGDATTIVNTGSISATSLLAIDTEGASTEIHNAGRITGFVDLTDNADRFLNQRSGVFETKLTSNFGGGNDLFRNAGGGTVQAASDPRRRETSALHQPGALRESRSDFAGGRARGRYFRDFQYGRAKGSRLCRLRQIDARHRRLPRRSRFRGRRVHRQRQHHRQDGFASEKHQSGFWRFGRGHSGGLCQRQREARRLLPTTTDRHRLLADLDYDNIIRGFDFEGGQVGGYATYLRGGLFVDTLLNVHLLDLETATLGFPSSLDATTVGLRTDTGYRFGSFNGGAFIEPLATLSVLWADIDGLALGGNRVSFDDDANVRGRLGLRVGTSYPAWTGTTVEPFVIGSLWGNLSGDNQATLVSNGTTFRFEDDLDGVWGEVSLWVNFFTPAAGTAVFAKVDVTFGDDVDGIGGKAGMRVSW